MSGIACAVLRARCRVGVVLLIVRRIGLKIAEVAGDGYGGGNIRHMKV